jgi:cytidylate kinase
MNTPIHQDARLAAFTEGQMRTWARLQETAARRQESGRSTVQAVRYVTISREAGADGETVARLVGERLGWQVYDKNLLDQVAQRYKEPRLMLDLVDETESNWVYDILGTWMDRRIIPHEKYAVQVSRLIRILARTGNAVFVGRGAQFVLPRSTTFAVRIVAPEAFRAQRVRQRRNTASQEALDWIHRTDRGRREFIRRFFRQDVNDPHLYDLVVNVEQFGPVGAADQIAHAVRLGRTELTPVH